MEPTLGGLDHGAELTELTKEVPHGKSGRRTQRSEKALLTAIVVGSAVIAGIGFTGSYAAVRRLAVQKGFTWFSYAFPVGVDLGIAVILALDVYLTWKRMSFWPLRMIAWVLTAATVAFNASVSWPDPVGTTMHGVIPVLFVIVVEAARHVVSRSADLTDDRCMDSIRWWRWTLSPVGTFRLWRRMKLWEIRSYDDVVRLERARVLYRKELRDRHGRKWRDLGTIEELRPLRLAAYGIWTQALKAALADMPSPGTAQGGPHSVGEPPARQLSAAATSPVPIAPVQQPVVMATQSPGPAVVNTPVDVTSALSASADAPSGSSAQSAFVSKGITGSFTPGEWTDGVLRVERPRAAGEGPVESSYKSAHEVDPGSWTPAASWKPGNAAPTVTEPRAEDESQPAAFPQQMVHASPQAGQPGPVADTEEPTSRSHQLSNPAPEPPYGASPGPALGPEPAPVTDEPSGRPLSKKQRARMIYVEHQRTGRELTRGRLAELVGYAQPGSARNTFNELQVELGPIVVRTPGEQLPVEFAASAARL
jgi:hypothetical protein